MLLGFPQEFILELLNAASGADTTDYGFLVGMKADLCQTDQPYDANTLLSSCTAGVCNYDGYAQKTLVWNKPSLSTDGTLELVSGSVTFRPTGSNTPNLARGVYCTINGSGSLGMCAPLTAAPVPMGSTLNLIELTLRVRVSPSGISLDVH